MNYVISVCNPKSVATLTKICADVGVKMAVVLHGRGTAVQSMLDILGIEDNEKRIVLSIADNDKTASLIREQKKQMFIE